MEAQGSTAANVKESWALYDTILICPTFYGSENGVRGWFTTLAAFGAVQEHRFFKARTEATATLPYNNLQSEDSMDFPFVVYNMGITFFAPSPNLCGSATPPDGGAGLVEWFNPGLAHFWTFDLPRHSSISFKTNQDIRAEVACYGAPPGYGPMGGGCAFELTPPLVGPPIEPLYKQHAQMNFYGTQGVPIATNRFKFPEPIEIAKNSVIEGTLNLSEYARYILTGVRGPSNYVFQRTAAGQTFFPQRFGVQFSLHGYRLIQQRGQYHI